MTKHILLLLILVIANTVYSQDKTRDEVLQLIADDACECIQDDETLFDKGKSMKQKQMALGVCLLRSYNKRKSESKAFEEKGIDDFEGLGEEVGLKMASTCGDAFIELFSDDQLGAMLDDDDDYGDVPAPPAAKDENDLNIEAELLSLNNDAISYITVSDSYNKAHTFIVSEQFEGYELLKKSNINSEFKIYYKEVNFFDLSERRYVKKKVIKYIEKI
ncbi:hypothetical protein [Psychroserpens sp. MEBiC05023]